MALHHQTLGDGPDIVLLHGWGLHGGIWDATDDGPLRRLARRYRVMTLDLPGHGYSDSGNDGFTLMTATETIAECLPSTAIVIGWSLGGLLAMHLALEWPERVRRLVLISSTARFSQAPDWQAAMTTTAMHGFATALLDNPQATVQRFLALQVRGSDDERRQLRLLKQALAARPPARPAALRSGLAILEHEDLRPRLGAIRQPCLLLYGQQDRIVPPGAATGMGALLPHATRHVLAGAGHAPFLSHPDATQQLLEAFIDA